MGGTSTTNSSLEGVCTKFGELKMVEPGPWGRDFYSQKLLRSSEFQ